MAQEKLNTFYDESNDMTFVQDRPVYDLDSIIEAIKSYRLIKHDMPYKPEEFLQKVYEYEIDHHYKYQDGGKKFKQRFGIHFTLLLPIGFEDRFKGDEYAFNRSLIALTEEFVRKIRGSEVYLRYVAWYVPIGDIARYIHIYLSDREFVEFDKVLYRKDFWQDKTSGKMCKAHDPNGALTHKKGEVKGYIHKTFKPAKTRILAARNEEELRKRGEMFREIWRTILLTQKLVFRNKLTFKRKKYSNFSNRFLRRIYQKCNWIMTEFENKIAIYSCDEVRQANWHDIKDGADPNDAIDTSLKRKIESLFYRYKEYFKKMKFTVAEGVKLSLNGRCDFAEAALDKLREKFNLELSGILSAT